MDMIFRSQGLRQAQPKSRDQNENQPKMQGPKVHFHFHNNFITNLMQSTITNSNLGPTLKSLCYPPITACCINFVKKILWTQQKKKKKGLKFGPNTGIIFVSTKNSLSHKICCENIVNVAKKNGLNSINKNQPKITTKIRLNQITTSEQFIQQKTYSNKKFKIHNHSNL